MNCIFCHGRSGTGLTREHLLSRPVAEAFGIDRGSSRVSIDGNSGAFDLRGVLASQSVQLACAACNNGWMNDLEHTVPAIAEWMRLGIAELTASQVADLQRWLVKTLIVLAFIDGDAKRFGADAPHAAIPPATHARGLYEGTAEGTAGCVFGAARARWVEASSFSYSFGNPTVASTTFGPRVANVSCFQLAGLELWVVVPLLRATVGLPARVTGLVPGLRYADLRVRQGRPDPTLVRVRVVGAP